jgi:hypothetical protein
VSAAPHTNDEGPPDARKAAQGGPSLSEYEGRASTPSEAGAPFMLGSLPVGARLLLRCRADWRAATVAAFEVELGRVVLNVASPRGGSYRVRRPSDALLTHDGHIPLLGEGHWRAGLARYDTRW